MNIKKNKNNSVRGMSSVLCVHGTSSVLCVHGMSSVL